MCPFYTVCKRRRITLKTTLLIIQYVSMGSGTAHRKEFLENEFNNHKHQTHPMPHYIYIPLRNNSQQ
jgi:hypothetical protein